MDFPIDIVIPWLNPTEHWYSTYVKYKCNENVGRIRDLGTFKYLLRSLFTNIPWFNKIFVLLYDQEQKPDWLIENDKLRIIYHNEFIPAEYLPNFNSLVTDMHISFIKDISEHFIFLNDDMFFLKTLPKEMFFTADGTPVHHPSIRPGKYKKYNTAQFRFIEENMFNFVNQITGQQILWKTFHMPIPFRKTFQWFIWYKYGNLIKPTMENSHIRSNHNICNWVFYALEEAMQLCQCEPIYNTYPCTCFDLKDGMNDIEQRISGKYIACLNDGDFLTTDFERVKAEIIDILRNKFSEPCPCEQSVI